MRVPIFELLFVACGVAGALPSSSEAAWCATVDQLLDRLSEGRGRLTAEAPLGGEVVILDEAAADDSALRDRLAYVLHAEWEGDKLVRRGATKQALYADDRQQRLRSIRRFVEQNVPITDASDTEAYGQRFRESLRVADDLIRNGYRAVTVPGSSFQVPAWALVQTPAQTLLNATIRALGEDVLADLPYYKTVVYSDQPTPVQRPLPNASQARRLLLRLSQEAINVLAEQSYSGSGMEPQLRDLGTYAEAVRDRGLSRLHLFLTARDGDIMCLFVLYDGLGRLAGTGSVRIPTRLPQDAPLPESISLEDVRISPLSQEVLAFMSPDRFSSRSELPRPSPEAQLAMYEPKQKDPLAYGVTEVLVEVARRNGLLLAACIQDSALNLLAATTRNGSADTASFLKELAREHEISRTDGWLLIRPRNPIDAERRRVNRGALQKLMDSAKANNGISLRAFAVYHSECGTAAYRSLITSGYQWFVNVHRSRAYPQLSDFENDDYGLAVLMYLGSLSEAEYAGLTSGKAQLDLGLLRTQQKDWIREIIGYRHLLLEALPGAESSPDWLLTGSEAAPTPSLQGVVLTAARTSSRAVVNQAMRWRTPDALLNRPLTLDEVRGSFGSWPDIDLNAALTGRYLVGVQHTLWVTIHVRPGIVRRFGIRLDFRPETEPLRFGDLPEDVRRAFGVGG